MPHDPLQRDSTLSPFALQLTRDLLRSIHTDAALKQTKPGRFDPSPDTLEDDPMLMEFPDAPADDCSVPSLHPRTVADTLDTGRIAERYLAGIDPFAIGADGSVHVPMGKPPLMHMIHAARIAAMFDTVDKLASLGSPQTVTLLMISDDAERYLFGDDFPDIFEQIALALKPYDIDLSDIATATLPNVLASSTSRARDEFRVKVERSLAAGKSVVAIAAQRADLPDSAKMVCRTVYPLPPITGDTIIEILRQTHSVTGQVSDAEICARLPDDVQLQGLPMPLLKGAFFALTTLQVADRLNNLSGNIIERPAVRVPTLDAVYLPPETRNDMRNLTDDLEAWRTGKIAWSEITSSVLLYGPPGTGKTLLAQALAGSACVPLITTSYGECQSKGHQGDFLRKLSERVEQAIEGAPCVFFIDELDSFSARSGNDRNARYMTGIVNALLEHLTHLNETPGVIVLGATNFRDNVDPAVRRPGRFDRHVALDTPDRAGIARIMDIELGSRAGSINSAFAVDRLLGVSGAQVAAVVRDARGRARRDRKQLSEVHLSDALDRIVPVGQTEDLYRIAVHEAGHAVVGHVLGMPLPSIVRVTPQGGAYVGKPPFAVTKRSVGDWITVTLAGRAAEACVLGCVSSGSESDLRQATEMAFRARYSWGLHGNNLVSLNEMKLAQLDPLAPLGSIVNADLKSHYLKAKEIVEANLRRIDLVAEVLLEQREMCGDKLAEVLSDASMRIEKDVQSSAG